MERAWDLVTSMNTQAARPLGDEDLPALEALMKRYEDRPMDFADASGSVPSRHIIAEPCDSARSR